MHRLKLGGWGEVGLLKRAKSHINISHIRAKSHIKAYILDLIRILKYRDCKKFLVNVTPIKFKR